MKRFLLHLFDDCELDETNYLDATDYDEAYRQALPLIEGCEEYQMSEL